MDFLLKIETISNPLRNCPVAQPRRILSVSILSARNYIIFIWSQQKLQQLRQIPFI